MKASVDVKTARTESSSNCPFSGGLDLAAGADVDYSETETHRRGHPL